MQLKLQIFVLLFSLSSVAQAKVVESVLAVVEGQMILKSDVRSFQKRLKRKNLVNENLISFLDLKTNSKSEKEILNYLIAKKIITVFAKKDLNISTLDDLISKELSGLAQQNQISVKQLKKEITSRGINFSEYKKFIGESSLIRSALEKNVVSQVRPTEEDFVSYLKQNGVSGIVPSYSYNLDQLFIPKSTPKALELAKSITKENFKDLFSSAKENKMESLHLGSLKSADLSKAHSKAVSSTQQNHVSSILTESKGYRVFYMNSKRGNFNIPNTAKVRSLQKQYYDTKIKTQFESWLSEIKPQFFVRIND
ncbi:MAG: hypothetical protein ACRBBP_06490 [Bdellovibrionales bacterium]